MPSFAHYILWFSCAYPLALPTGYTQRKKRANTILWRASAFVHNNGLVAWSYVKSASTSIGCHTWKMVWSPLFDLSSCRPRLMPPQSGGDTELGFRAECAYRPSSQWFVIWILSPFSEPSLFMGGLLRDVQLMTETSNRAPRCPEVGANRRQKLNQISSDKCQK